MAISFPAPIKQGIDWATNFVKTGYKELNKDTLTKVQASDNKINIIAIAILAGLGGALAAGITSYLATAGLSGLAALINSTSNITIMTAFLGVAILGVGYALAGNSTQSPS